MACVLVGVGIGFSLSALQQTGPSVKRESSVPQPIAPSEHRFEELYLFWRKMAGNLSCQIHGVGPTGGFCRSRLSPGHGGGAMIGKHLAHELGSTVFGASSVIDIGCGLGQYGRYFKKTFPDVSWLGVDYPPLIEG